MLTYITEMVIVNCCNCGMAFAMTNDFYRRRSTEGGNFYCPSGHSQYYTTTENQRLKNEVDRLARQKQLAEDDATHHEEARRRVERKLAATKGVVTRVKKRINNGVCPCCQRHFCNMERHMRSKHPQYIIK